MTEKPAREWGSGSYSTHVYAVEARSRDGEIALERKLVDLPVGLRHVILTEHDWKRIPVSVAAEGILNDLELYPDAKAHGFMTYACAMGVCCQLQAMLRWGGIETRLVQIEFSASYQTKELGHTAPLDLHSDDIALFHRLRKERGEQAEAVQP